MRPRPGSSGDRGRLRCGSEGLAFRRVVGVRKSRRPGSPYRPLLPVHPASVLVEREPVRFRTRRPPVLCRSNQLSNNHEKPNQRRSGNPQTQPQTQNRPRRRVGVRPPGRARAGGLHVLQLHVPEGRTGLHAHHRAHARAREARRVPGQPRGHLPRLPLPARLDAVFGATQTRHPRRGGASISARNLACPATFTPKT